MLKVIVMSIMYAGGTIFSPPPPVVVIQGFSSVEACEANIPQAIKDFTRHYQSHVDEVPSVNCYSYAN